MKIEVGNHGVVKCSLTLTHNGKEKTVHNLVLDTGAAETIIYRRAVRDLDIHLEENDEFVFMRGIGGRESALRKTVHLVQFMDFKVSNFLIDFGDDTQEYDHDEALENNEFNGLLGLDVLTVGGFIIDLEAMEVYRNVS